MTILLLLISIPAYAEWVKGDGHIHSGWFSPWDASYDLGKKIGPTIVDQIKAAQEQGLKWIIFTEHEEMLKAPELVGLGEVWQAHDSQDWLLTPFSEPLLV